MSNDSGKSLYVIVAGCGRLGSYIANRLSEAGHSVVIIDPEENAFSRLSDEFSGFRVEGDATEFAVLQEAKVDKADLLIAATREDNVNLLVAQVARRIFEVPSVIARVLEPSRTEIYSSLDIKTVCPTLIAADTMLVSAGLFREEK